MRGIKQYIKHLCGNDRRAPIAPPYNTTSFSPRAHDSELTRMFHRIRDVPGWFNIDDCAHFSLILNMQNATGVQGDILEIGSYHGRSTGLLASHLKNNETLVVCDAFAQETDDPYDRRPTPDVLMSNIGRIAGQVNASSIDIHSCLSSQLSLEPGKRFRFSHIDGGHDFATVTADLHVAWEHSISGGVVVVDDYKHDDFPQVTTALDVFLDNHSDCAVLADLNRHGAIGRKVYLIKP